MRAKRTLNLWVSAVRKTIVVSRFRRTSWRITKRIRTTRSRRVVLWELIKKKFNASDLKVFFCVFFANNNDIGESGAK